MSEYFPEPNSLGVNIKVELDLSNYTTKADFNNVTGVDPSSFAKKTDLANLKSNVDKLDIDKLKNVPTNLNNLKSKLDTLDIRKLETNPVDLNRLSDLVKNDVVQKDVYSAKIKTIEDKIPDITNLSNNASLNSNKNEVKGEIPSITNLATNTSLNAKINEVKGEIPNITNLATNTGLTAFENKIPNVSNLVKKADYATKISEMENKYFTISDYNEFTNNILDTKTNTKKFN